MIEDIKIYKDINLTNPVLIAGWPGMGSVALGVVDYLRKNLKAEKFAEITVDAVSALDSVLVEGGLASIPPVPRNTFYYAKNPDIVIFEGEAQLPRKEGLELLGKVLDLASILKVMRIYTGAAFAMPISYKEAPEIFGAVNKKALIPILKKYGIRPMDGGHISGLNGLVLGFALEKNIDAICFLATMPQYAINLPNPKASGAILGILKKMLNLEMSLEDLEAHIRDMDEKMAMIEDRVKDVLTIENAGTEPHQAEKKLPVYIRDKIERLFSEARIDRSKAIELKRELDRWDLYKMYEDRFLDLFKDNV